MTKKITGAIFANTSGNPKAPSFKGNIEIDGEKIPVILWKKTSKSGIEYYSINNDESIVKDAKKFLTKSQIEYEREERKENGAS